MSAFKTWLNGLTSKSTPVDADETYLRDSEAAGASKKLTWANIKATLKTYFDGLYLALTGGTVAGGTRTTSGSTLTITETLNNAGVTFPGALVVDVTDTASNAESLLADLKVGGVSKFKVRKDGRPTFAGSGTDWVFDASLASGTMVICYGGGANEAVAIDWNAQVTLSNAFKLGWSSAGGPRNPQDLTLHRDAAGTLAQRNDTNAQTFRNYGTWTDASNGRWLNVSMTTAGVATITPTGNGTGASGNVLHISGLPTSNPGAGILWNDTGTVKVGI